MEPSLEHFVFRVNSGDEFLWCSLDKIPKYTSIWTGKRAEDVGHWVDIIRLPFRIPEKLLARLLGTSKLDAQRPAHPLTGYNDTVVLVKVERK